ncbi:MAG: MlaD family protein [Kiritimatiellia bacterium]
MNSGTRRKEVRAEVIVGLFVVAAFAGLIVFTAVLSRESWFGYKRRLELVFNDVRGLREGDKVMVRGMPVGKVDKLTLSDGEKRIVRVEVIMDKPVTLYEDCSGEVMPSSVFGGKLLRLNEGSSDKPLLKEGQVIRGEPGGDMIADATEVMAEIKKGLIEDGAVDNLARVSSDLRELTERIKEGKGMIGKLLSEDETLYKDLSASAASLRDITERIENGEGLLGKAVSDDELYTQLKQILEEGRATIDDLRETAPVVTFTSIMFGAF